MFGPEDNFLNQFAFLRTDVSGDSARMPDAQFQPVFVGDVAKAIVNVLDLDAASGRTYELAGPTVYTLEELVQIQRRGDRQARADHPLAGQPRPPAGDDARNGARRTDDVARQSRFDENAATSRAGRLRRNSASRPASIEAIAPMYLTGSVIAFALQYVSRAARALNFLFIPYAYRMKLVIGDKNYSSWSMRPWLVLKHFDIPFDEMLIRLGQPDSKREYPRAFAVGEGAVPDHRCRRRRLGIARDHGDAGRAVPAARACGRATRPRARTRAASARKCTRVSRDLREQMSMNIRRSRFRARTRRRARWRTSRASRRSGSDCLDAHGGPFLFGEFGIADAMFAPVVMRFNSYAPKLAKRRCAYARARDGAAGGRLDAGSKDARQDER